MSFELPQYTPAHFIREAEEAISQRSDGIVASWTFTTQDFVGASSWVMQGSRTGDYLYDTASGYAHPLPIDSIELDGLANSFAKIVVRFKLPYTTSTATTGGAETTVDGETVVYEMEGIDLMKPLATHKLFVTAFNASMTLNKPAAMNAAQDALFVRAFGSTFPRSTNVIELAEAGVRIPEARGVILLCNIEPPLLGKYWLRMDGKRDTWESDYPVLVKTTKRPYVKAGDYHGHGAVLNSAPAGFPGAPNMKYRPKPSRVRWDPVNKQCEVVERFVGIDDYDSELYE